VHKQVFPSRLVTLLGLPLISQSVGVRTAHSRRLHQAQFPQESCSGSPPHFPIHCLRVGVARAGQNSRRMEPHGLYHRRGTAAARLGVCIFRSWDGRDAKRKTTIRASQRSSYGLCGLIIEQEKGSTLGIAAASLGAAMYSCSQLASLQRCLALQIENHSFDVGSAGSAKPFPPHSPPAPPGSPSSQHQVKIKRSARQCHLALCAREGCRK
jgi:hypothetical protein